MPHSSGGGSHGGGYHSSSHSSSPSRSMSSYSSGGGGGSTRSSQPVTRKPYTGATRYVWYGRGGACHSLYQKGEPDRSELGTTILAIVFLTVVAAPILWFLLKVGLYVPRPLDTASYDARIAIEDTVGLTEGSALEEALLRFRDTTGVAPGVEILRDSEWKPNYKDLETFALSEYLRLFDDEKHWLVVLSWPDNVQKTEFIDWSWEGMIGDDCYPAFNSDSEDLFTKTMQKHLLRATPDTIGTALADAFNEFSEIGMDTQIGGGWLFVAGLVALLYLALAIYFIAECIDSRHILRAVPVEQSAREYNCEYCGTLYVAGTVTKCPGCGAPIPARNLH